MIKNIQILRAFAAINVVIFHIIYTSNVYKYETKIFNVLNGWGASGVDLFFVVSGFIIFHTQYNNKKNFINFVISRFTRIVPLYWLITTIYIILFFLFPKLFKNLQISHDSILYSFFFISQIMNESWPIVNVGWTLEYEMFFYIFFSIFILIKFYNIFFLNIIFLLIALIYKKFLLLEFLLGINIGYIFNNFKINRRLNFFLFFIGFFALIISIKSFHLIKITNDLDRLIFWGIPSFLIVIGFIYSKEIKNKIFLFLGDASYSIYLTHFMIVTAFYKFCNIVNLELDNDLIALLCLILSILGSCFFYFIFEKPIMYFFKKNHKVIFIKY